MILLSLEERSVADDTAVPALNREAEALSSGQKEGLSIGGSYSGEVQHEEHLQSNILLAKAV